MKYQYEVMTDLCPVCCESKPELHQVYCSEHCRSLAYNYRKRLVKPLKNLSAMGFNCTYRNGVQLIVKLPPVVAECYPRSLSTLEFPDPCLDIARITPAMFWEAIRFHFGNVVGGMIEYLATRGWFESKLCTDLLYSSLTATINDYRTTFQCVKCERRFILSVCSRDGIGGLDRCTDCAVEREPF
jgi:hypothetical protein